MAEYKSYINALRKCAKEHKNEIVSFAHIRTVDLCNDTADLLEKLETEIIVPKDAGEVSDGYHTFNQLYHQRAILFATIVNQNKDVSWKSYKHSDGKYCFNSNGEWFIVGVDTPKGSYTYHYSKEYWDYFDCRELDCGKEWDGHAEEDVTRLLSLGQGYFEDAVNRQQVQEQSKIMMRDATLEELEAVDKRIKDISKATGVDFWDSEQTSSIEPFMNKPCVSARVCEHDKLEALNKLRSKIVSYRRTIGNAIEEDELKIEGMKEAYTDCIGMIDEYISEMEGNE